MHLTPRLYNDKDLSSHQARQTVLSEQSRLFIYLFFFWFCFVFFVCFCYWKGAAEVLVNVAGIQEDCLQLMNGSYFSYYVNVSGWQLKIQEGENA